MVQRKTRCQLCRETKVSISLYLLQFVCRVIPWCHVSDFTFCRCFHLFFALSLRFTMNSSSMALKNTVYLKILQQHNALRVMTSCMCWECHFKFTVSYCKTIVNVRQLTLIDMSHLMLQPRGIIRLVYSTFYQSPPTILSITNG